MKDINNIVLHKDCQFKIIKEAERRRSPKGVSIRFALAECECGVVKEVRLSCLVNGKSPTCGCRKKRFIGNFRRSHQMVNSPEWNSWRAMRERCNNPKYRSYHRYGGRGIKYDKDWESFESFYRDMGTRPDGKTLDRIDNNGNYCKNDCKWSNSKEQNNNRNNNIK